MAGIYLHENKVKKSIEDWENAIISLKGTWEGNNLHIDEIVSLDKITRSEWINFSFMILNILVNKFKSIDSLILFLQIELKYSLKKMSLDKLSLKWLKENVSEYTPPSLNFTSLEYYTDFYEKELVTCKPNNSILELIHSSKSLDFFYRTSFDEDEQMYSREVYVFIRD